jgi:hypothetical protein
LEVRVALIELIPMIRMKKVPTGAETLTSSWRGSEVSCVGVTVTPPDPSV